MEKEDRKRALDLALSQIEKNFGKGAVMKLGTDAHNRDVSVVPSGALGLDIALGIGGYPRGRVVEIYGPESSGKTTLALQAIAEAQKAGGTAAFIDAEHALDVNYAKKLNVSTDELLLSQPDNGEQALEIADTLIRSGAVEMVVIDSVAALVPRSELEGDMGDPQMGVQARLMSQALRKLTATISRSNSIIIFINQIRMKIGVMFGNPETTTGGNALKFYATVRLEIRRIQSLKDGENVIGNRVKVRVVKNKMAPPFREAEFDMIYGLGISRESDILDLATNYKILEKTGTWFTYGKEKLGQGRENARAYLAEHPEIAKELEKKILAQAGVRRGNGAEAPKAEPVVLAAAQGLHDDSSRRPRSSAEGAAAGKDGKDGQVDRPVAAHPPRTDKEPVHAKHR